MTEYELLDSVVSYATGGGTFFTIWLTILSAYAITAYVTGRNFTSFQLVWLNTLYIFAAGLSIFGFVGMWRSQIFYIAELKVLRPDSPQILTEPIVYIVTATAVIGTLVTLVFMWQVRHPKAV